MTEQVRKQTVLIVDDEPGNIRILSELLHAEYNILAATEGETALQIARSGHPPDLVLLDVVMPGTDGYEVCKKLKKDDRTKNIPVIFITVLGDEQAETKGFELGAIDYVTKPFSPVVVKARIKTHLERQQLIRDLQASLTQVKTLSGMLPICASCKKIRNDEGYWEQIEVYIRDRSTVDFSHGICPDCINKLYPGLDKK